MRANRFDALYAQHLRALKLQGKAEATVDSFARAVRRVAAYSDRCPVQLTTEDFKHYFAALIDTRSWSLVKIERCGLQFFYAHVLGREWPWVDMVKAAVVHSLPDVLLLAASHFRPYSATRARFSAGIGLRAVLGQNGWSGSNSGRG